MVSFQIESIAPILRKETPAVFFDCARPGSIDHYSYLFYKPVRILKTNKFSEVSQILEEVDLMSKKYWLAGYVAYEAAYGLEEKLNEIIPSGLRCNFNLVWFGVFERPFQFNHAKGTWSPSQPQVKINKRTIEKACDNFGDFKNKLTFSITYKNYARAIRRIKRWIGLGHTYQINFTFDSHVENSIPPYDLYLFLRSKQRTPYCAYIQTEDEQILSFSPELFFKKHGSHITVKPMKGTAPRGHWDEEDKTLKNFLHNDIKNRSENIMIVDLLRNDLGKICKTGEVKPVNLFSVETHPTLYQMTSTIQGALRPRVGYKDIFSHIFPSGSVTGAPKIRTMEIINQLECGRRKVYCGALGYISPQNKALFSVPIRILQRQNDKKRWTYRVGSGIVWDSSAQTEWRECKTKCQFLNIDSMPDFEIFETILWNNRFSFLKDHLHRFKKSADYFEFPYSYILIKKELAKIRARLKGRDKKRVRIFLNKEGALRWDYFILEDKKWDALAPVFLSKEAVDENNIFLYHKTTHRPWYAKAMKQINKGRYFDIVFVNSKGYITEGARTNIFIKKGSRFYTPPVQSGLLPGILREHLIRTGKCIEKAFKAGEIKNADAVYCGNSVRGLQRVFLKK